MNANEATIKIPPECLVDHAKLHICIKPNEAIDEAAIEYNSSETINTKVFAASLKEVKETKGENIQKHFWYYVEKKC